MANACVSALNFGQTTTNLQFGRPFTTIVKDDTATAVSEGSHTLTSGSTVTRITQSVTYANVSGVAMLVTPIFIRPSRILSTSQPQIPNYQEFWGMTIGNPPAAPSLAITQTRFGGGIGYSIGGTTYMSEASATYAPFGQVTLPAGQQIRIDYQCKLVITFNTSGARYGYARNHRIIILADLTTDPAV